MNSDPFETDPEPTGPQFFERGGKQYVRDSRLGEFFNFLVAEISHAKTLEFIDSLHAGWERYGSLSTAQYEKLMDMIDSQGGPDVAIENAPEEYELLLDQDEEDEIYFGD